MASNAILDHAQKESAPDLKIMPDVAQMHNVMWVIIVEVEDVDLL